MKTLQEIRNEIKYLSSPELIENVLKDWADSIVDKILQDPSMIYAVDEDGNDCGDRVEALYNYEAFETFKNSIK